MLNFENLNRAVFNSVGDYDIPVIAPVTEMPVGDFIPINYHYAEKNPESKNLHFFVDDYQFIRYWNTPDKYINKLSEFRAVCAPDFSTYTDMPLAVQIYNHYRKHWLAAYWQKHNFTVYPTISWSAPDSYAWCFDGEPANSIVAVSSVGTQKHKESKRLFLSGYAEMMRRLSPTGVIFYGVVPPECEEYGGTIIRVKPHQDLIAERRKAKKTEECGNTQYNNN